MSDRIRILVTIGHYLPGYRAGGPVRTVANMVEWLGDELELNILTSDRDLRARKAYPGIPVRVWQKVRKANVMYLSPFDTSWWAWWRRLNSLEYDVVYLNSFFSRLSIKTAVLRWLRLIPDKPTILAPRGEFSRGALALKHLKKQVYLSVTKGIGLYQNIVWQASSEYEKQDILNVFDERRQWAGRNVQVVPDLAEPSLIDRVVPNLLSITADCVQPGSRVKASGSAKIVFLSRVARMKNLDFALRVLSEVQGEVEFDIYGPLEDIAYWRECETLIRQLPPVIQVHYKGEVVPEQVTGVFSQYHLFFLPTRGENFGHVISEALRAGRPVLISDQTPWQGLEEKKAGWVIPLSQPEKFRAVLNKVIEMDDATFQEWSSGARIYGEQRANDPAVIEANRRLFMAALNQK